LRRFGIVIIVFWFIAMGLPVARGDDQKGQMEEYRKQMDTKLKEFKGSWKN